MDLEKDNFNDQSEGTKALIGEILSLFFYTGKKRKP